MRKIWLDNEILTIKDMYENYTNKEILKFIDATEIQINSKANKLGLKKQYKKTDKKWNDEEIQIIKDMYKDFTNKEISDYIKQNLNIEVNPKQIKGKGVSLRLLKSKEVRSKNIGIRNKIVGRDLTYDFVKNEVLKYNTKSELQEKDGSCYAWLVTNNLVNEFCSHMIPQSFSIPQMMLYQLLRIILPNENIVYNTRKIIKPYELDIYIESKSIGFEYNGKGWHVNNENDKIKINLCKEKNIELFIFIENSRRYEDDIKNQFNLILNQFNNIFNLDIKKEDINNIDLSIVYSQLISDDSIKNICNQYNDFSLFRKEQYNLYLKLLKMKKLHEYTLHMKRYVINWTEDLIKKEISKYKTLKEFYTNSHSCYLFISRNKKFKYLLELFNIY
jgi:hypothetical protein